MAVTPTARIVATINPATYEFEVDIGEEKTFSPGGGLMGINEHFTLETKDSAGNFNPFFYRNEDGKKTIARLDHAQTNHAVKGRFSGRWSKSATAAAVELTEHV